MGWPIAEEANQWLCHLHVNHVLCGSRYADGVRHTQTYRANRVQGIWFFTKFLKNIYIYSVTSKNNYTSNKSTQWAQLSPSSKSYTKTYIDVSIGNVEIPNYDIAFVDHFCWCQNNMKIFCSIFISLCHYEVIMLYWKRKKFLKSSKRKCLCLSLKFGSDSMET